MNSSRLKIVCGVLIWAVINGLIIRGASQYLSPTALGAAMSLVGLIPLRFVLKKISIPRRHVRVLMMLGITAALNNSFFYTAIAVKNVSTIVLVHYFAASLAVLWAHWVPSLRERFSIRNVVSVALGFAGLLVMLGKDWFAFEPWMAYALLSAFFYSWEVIYSRRAGIEAIDPSHSAFSKLSFQVILMPCVGLFLGQSLRVPISTWLPIIGAGLLLVLSFWLVFEGLKRVSATHFSMLAYLDRLGAIAIGFFWWHEPVGMRILIGGLLILVAEIPILFLQSKKEA